MIFGLALLNAHNLCRGNFTSKSVYRTLSRFRSRLKIDEPLQDSRRAPGPADVQRLGSSVTSPYLKLQSFAFNDVTQIMEARLGGLAEFLIKQQRNKIF